MHPSDRNCICISIDNIEYLITGFEDRRLAKITEIGTKTGIPEELIMHCAI